MSDEIEQVAELLTSAAEMLLPHVQPRQKTRWRDDTLSVYTEQCCLEGLERRAGCPTESPLYEEKSRLHQPVRRKVCFCAAREDRLHIQR